MSPRNSSSNSHSNPPTWTIPIYSPDPVASASPKPLTNPRENENHPPTPRDENKSHAKPRTPSYSSSSPLPSPSLSLPAYPYVFLFTVPSLPWPSKPTLETCLDKFREQEVHVFARLSDIRRPENGYKGQLALEVSLPTEDHGAVVCSVVELIHRQVRMWDEMVGSWEELGPPGWYAFTGEERWLDEGGLVREVSLFGVD